MGKTQTVRLSERVARPFQGSTVDRDAGTISSVLICGTESANRRDYPPAVFRRDFAKYEGKPVNCDHGREPTVDRRFGWFTGVHVGDDGRPRGILHALKSHPMYERVMEAAERNPALFGFSHVALCDTSKGAGGREVVEAIRDVESIDLVAEPATTKGLFEHVQGGRAVPTTLRQFIESLTPRMAPDRQKAARRMLVEMDDGLGMAPMADAPVDEPAADADPDDAAKKAVRDLVLSIVDDDGLSAEEKLKKIRLVLQMGDKLTGAAPADTSTEPPAAESRKPAVDKDTVKAECKAAKFNPTWEQGESLLDIANPDTRKTVIESWKALAERTTSGGERVRVAGRHESAKQAEGDAAKLAESKNGKPARVTLD